VGLYSEDYFITTSTINLYSESTSYGIYFKVLIFYTSYCLYPWCLIVLRHYNTPYHWLPDFWSKLYTLASALILVCPSTILHLRICSPSCPSINCPLSPVPRNCSDLYSVSPPFWPCFPQLSTLQLSHTSRFLFPLFNFGLLSLAGQKVSVVQHKVFTFHRSSFTSKCWARVPCHKLCHKLASSSHDLVLFLKMSCSVCKMLLPQLPCLVHSLFVSEAPSRPTVVP
jgi:hypothetical protein